MFRNLAFEMWTDHGNEVIGRVVSKEDVDCVITKDSFRVTYKPEMPVKLNKFRAIFHYEFKPEDKVFANGWQSWTNSREYGKAAKREKQRGLGRLGRLPLVKRFSSIFGDYGFTDYKKLGMVHSSMYGYIRKPDEKYLLLGSLNDEVGFTTVYYDLIWNRIILEKDLEGKSVYEPIRLLDIAYYEGSYNEVFDKYFANFKIDKSRMKRLTGYTSWYNYFGRINEEIIYRDLDGMDKIAGSANIFQIDDGWQKATGEWTETDSEKFPNGMKPVADKIHSKGLLAGIWLAPFAVARKSKLAIDHPEWLILNKKGKPEIGAISWGGAYTLDILNEKVREYIRSFFKVILDDWGFDMVKLDFLYAQCLTPRDGMSRGEIMSFAMDFLRECVGDKMILGCGVPLASAIGRVDACRIGCDVDLRYKKRRTFEATNREVLSAQSAINNSLMRRHLDGRAFVSDPDVFFLRDGNLKFSEEQKMTLAKVNKLSGGVLFVSDNIGKYKDAQINIIKEIFEPSLEKITKVNIIDNNYYDIETESGGVNYAYRLNLRLGTMTQMVSVTELMKKGEGINI